jgi:putative flippase GtrA
MNAAKRLVLGIRRVPGAGNVLQRWFAFNLIGVLGIGVQLLTLAALYKGIGLHYLLATGLAVETAILHNYCWHMHWTWADRPRRGRENLLRLLRFNLSTGLLSIAGNLALMDLFARQLQFHWMTANLAAIGACSVLNFLLSHCFIFQAPTPAQ